MKQISKNQSVLTKYFRKGKLAALLPLLIGITVLMPMSPASADLEQDAWVLADNPTVRQYTPNPKYTNNPTNEPTIITRNGTGLYTIRFIDHKMTKGNAQVTAFGSTASCAITRWHNELLGISCTDHNGKPTDTKFSAYHTNKRENTWALADQPTRERYTPNSSYLNQRTLIARNGTGRYTIKFIDRNLNGGNIQVTPQDSNASCAITRWVNDLTGVSCTGHNGKPTDTKFNVHHTGKKQHAWVFGGNPVDRTYTPSLRYTNNPANQPTTITRNGTGLYTIRFIGHAMNNGNAQVTAFGSTASCAITGWGNELLGISCTDHNGKPTDTKFSARHINDTRINDTGLSQGVVTGAVTYAGKPPVHGAIVKLAGQTRAVGSDGRYRFTHVPPGKQTIEASTGIDLCGQRLRAEKQQIVHSEKDKIVTSDLRLVREPLVLPKGTVCLTPRE